VERVVDPADRRAVRIELSKAGQALLDRRTERARVAFEPAVAALSNADRKQFSQLLHRMTEALTKDR
jgi:DNA-binding MarR family transcriptional regulator